jgi:hypothetical protein
MPDRKAAHPLQGGSQHAGQIAGQACAAGALEIMLMIISITSIAHAREAGHSASLPALLNGFGQ